MKPQSTPDKPIQLIFSEFYNLVHHFALSVHCTSAIAYHCAIRTCKLPQIYSKIYYQKQCEFTTSLNTFQLLGLAIQIEKPELEERSSALARDAEGKKMELEKLEQLLLQVRCSFSIGHNRKKNGSQFKFQVFHTWTSNVMFWGALRKILYRMQNKPIRSQTRNSVI